MGLSARTDPPRPRLQFLTDFADQAVMLPLALVVALAFAVARWRRGLLGWVVGVGFVLVTMALLKMVFFACGAALGASGIHSPSGHTAAATALYGGGLVLALRGRLPSAALAILPAVFALLFGLSRLALGAHDGPEVLAGAVVGMAGAGLMVGLSGVRPPMRLWPGVLVVLVVVAALHGRRLQAEELLHQVAARVGVSIGHGCETRH